MNNFGTIPHSDSIKKLFEKYKNLGETIVFFIEGSKRGKESVRLDKEM